MTQIHLRNDQRAAYNAFLETYPEYAATSVLDDLRTEEFGRLDDLGQVYLDYTGAGLYAASQVQRHGALLTSGVFGNPHSGNPPSTASTELIESCRRRVLRFFNASPEVYSVVFTSNASQALKLVGEAYPFESGDQFLLTFDNHNSVNGIREFDRAHSSRTRYIPVLPPDLVTDYSTVERHLQVRVPGRHNLFAFPAQSNFSGVQHPLEWVTHAQDLGWDVLVDAAAFVPTNRLDLMESIGVSIIHERVRCLSAWLLAELLALRHPNGRRLVRLYGPVTMKGRGTLAFNFVDADGAVIDHQTLERRAGHQNIALRTGCFCNPGAGEVALGLSEDELTRCFRGSEDRMNREDLIRCIDAEAGGAVRVSVGLASNFADTHRFVTFAREFL